MASQTLLRKVAPGKRRALARCVKTCDGNVPDVAKARKGGNMLKLAKLLWLDVRTVALFTLNGEVQFTV